MVVIRADYICPRIHLLLAVGEEIPERDHPQKMERCPFRSSSVIDKLGLTVDHHDPRTGRHIDTFCCDCFGYWIVYSGGKEANKKTDNQEKKKGA